MPSWHDTHTSCSKGHSRTQGLPPHSPGPCSRSRWWAGGSRGIWTWRVVILLEADPCPLTWSSQDAAWGHQSMLFQQCHAGKVGHSDCTFEKPAQQHTLHTILSLWHNLCPWSQTCSRPVSSWLLLQIMWPSSSRKYSDSMLLPQSWHLKHSGWYSFSLEWEMQVYIYYLNIFEKYFPCCEVLVCDWFTASITQKFFLYPLWNLPSSALKILSSRIWWPIFVSICSFQL